MEINNTVLDREVEIALPKLEITESPCGRYHILTNRHNQFKLEIPIDWQITASLTSRYGLQFFVHKEREEFDTTIKFVISPVEENETLTQVIQNQKGIMEASGILAILSGKFYVTDKKWEVLFGKIIGVSKEEVKVKNYFKRLSNAVYCFWVTSETSQFKIAEPAVDHMVRTFVPLSEGL